MARRGQHGDYRLSFRCFYFRHQKLAPMDTGVYQNHFPPRWSSGHKGETVCPHTLLIPFLSLSFFLFTVRRCPPYTFPYTEADDTTEDENGVSVTQGGIAARNDWFRSGCCLSAYLSRYWMSVEATLGGHANGAVSWRSVVTRIQTNRGVFTGGPHRCVWTQIVLPMLAGKFRRFRMVSSTSRDERWNHTTLQTG